jgi:hypothetical protein
MLRRMKMKKRKLVELAKTIRSKNASPNKMTFDIIFREKENYELVKNSGVINEDLICKLYNVTPDDITDFVTYDPANAIKFTIYRSFPSGNPGDPDIYGARQYAPLMDIEIPVED